MDIFKGKRIHTQRSTKQLNKPTTHKERTQGAKPLRPFFLRIVRKGKENNNTPTKSHKDKRKDKAREQAKESRHKGKRIKAGQTQIKNEKRRQTRNKPLIRLTPHAHKSHTSHKKRQNKQTHTNPIKPSKNALKTRNGAIFASDAPSTKR